MLTRLIDYFRRESQPERIIISDESVTRYRADGVQESVRWDELVEVGIVTTDEGPWFEDVFWILIGEEGKGGCAIGQGIPGADRLLDTLQKLPGFDDEAVIKAMSSTSNDRFVCWKR
jgi:hypothetical protein